MKKATIDKTVTFEGSSPNTDMRRLLKPKTLKQPISISIKQPEKEGLYWKIGENGKENPINIHHLYAYKTPIINARQLVLSDQEDIELNNKYPHTGEKAFVVEHILSAFNYVGITDATIQLDPSFFNPNIAHAPIVGPGITKLVNELKKHKLELDSESKFLEVKQQGVFFQYLNGKNSELGIKPSEKLEVTISKSDLGAMQINPQEIYLADAYKELDIDARPVARLNTYTKAKAIQILNKIGFKGVSPETYVMGTNNCKEEDIVKRMRPQFQEGKNEQLWHGAIDRTGELFAVAGLPIKGNFSYKNVNHLSAVKTLKELYKIGFLSISK